MYETLSFRGAPMDTDGRGSAWFDIAGPSYFPAFKTPEPTFAFKTPDVLASSYPTFNSGVNNTVPSTTNSFNRATPIYKIYLREMMRGRGSSKARFKYTVAEEPMPNASCTSNRIRYQFLTAMREYLNKSFEEIRLEDYIASSVHDFENDINTRVVSEPPLTKQAEEPTRLKPVGTLSESPVLDTILQNVANIMNQRNVTVENTNDDPSSAVSNDATFNLLQTLLNNVKQRFDVNCLSEDAKRNCARVTQAFAEFTEKTLENLTVIVLEDMLNNIRSRSTTVHDTGIANKYTTVHDTATANKYTSTCSCLERNSHQEKETELVEDRNKLKKSYSNKRDDGKVSPKYRGDYSSVGEDSAERTELVCDETEHRCELTPGAGKGSRKKAASVPTTLNKTKSWFTRSARHSYCGMSKSADKISRYRSHRKLSDEKYNYREKTYDDSEIDEVLNRSHHESKYGHRDDGWVTITKAKHNRENNRSKKRSSRKLQLMTRDECRVCENFKNVSLDDVKRKEYSGLTEKSRFPRCKGRLYELEKDVNEGPEGERERADKSTNALSVNVDEAGVARNQFDELQSYSDTSSI